MGRQHSPMRVSRSPTPRTATPVLEMDPSSISSPVSRVCSAACLAESLPVTWVMEIMPEPMAA